ncbi:type I restriction modification DNA specificity domain protein [Finegoldia magna ACS-171-V-Col3]|uniref:restriction endonuclease subunit S n=1 Tax=Finegoldia magna TaxID=1260 RepID=UPI0001DE48CA|nr:restriction endonuclease subunit S [Finegoldia magna]EFK94106.1 type I restriction modification DNA specificity domain protein [Finegoldia magna ACS-171-V-Col3]
MTRKMKDSGIEWIGEIPEDWEISKFKRYSKSAMGNTILKTDLEENNNKETIPVYSATQEDVVFGYIDENNVTVILKKNNLVIPARGNSIGFTKLVPYAKATCTQTTIFSRLNNINEKFVYYCSIAFKDSWFEFDQTAIPQITVQQVENNNIPICSIEEQCKITNFLSNKLENVKNIKIIITNQIENLENYKKSVITEAVTKGLDKNVEMKDSGIEWIGEIPKHWDLIKLKFIAHSISKGISPHYVEETLTPVVNQATFSKGFFDSNLKYCSEKPIGEGLLKMNDVLLATTGGGVLGKTYYFEEKGKYLASTDVAYIRNKDKYISKFIYYILSVNYDLLNGIFAKGSTNQTHLQMDLLSNMHIPLPNQNELSKIISKLDVVNTNIDDSIAIKQKQLDTLEEYKKSLIYEYVTGKKEVKDGEES